MNASYQPEGELVDEAKADDDPLKTQAKLADLRNKAFASKAFQDKWKKSPSNANNPKSPYYDAGTRTP